MAMLAVKSWTDAESGLYYRHERTIITFIIRDPERIKTWPRDVEKLIGLWKVPLIPLVSNTHPPVEGMSRSTQAGQDFFVSFSKLIVLRAD